MDHFLIIFFYCLLIFWAFFNHFDWHFSSFFDPLPTKYMVYEWFRILPIFHYSYAPLKKLELGSTFLIRNPLSMTNAQWAHKKTCLSFVTNIYKLIYKVNYQKNKFFLGPIFPPQCAQNLIYFRRKLRSRKFSTLSFVITKRHRVTLRGSQSHISTQKHTKIISKDPFHIFENCKSDLHKIHIPKARNSRKRVKICQYL